MNLVFISGKIVENIKFDFIINSKHVSIARFKVQLKNKSIVDVIAYDEMADYCYKNLQPKMQLYMEGKLNSRMEIDIINRINNYGKEKREKSSPPLSLDGERACFCE